MFSTDKSKNETTDENDDDDEDVDDDGVGKEDFLLALFIAQQDPGLTESKPDQNHKSDPDFGHFCAPWVPGFCKANFCIFHHPINPPGDASNNNNLLENTNAT